MKTTAYTSDRSSESSDWLSHGGQLEGRSFGPQSERDGVGGIDLLKGPVFAGGMPVRAKLTIGEPNDKYEQEADRVAEQVMSTPDSATHQSIQREDATEESAVQTKPLAATITPIVQREMAPEEEDEDHKLAQPKLIQREEALKEEDEDHKPVQSQSELQRKVSPAGFQAQPRLEQQLDSSKGGGAPLPDDVRAFMEPRFGADFSQVRVHTGNESVQMNRDLNAQAFTHKQDVYYGAGKSPGNDALTAHELTHIIQQTGGIQAKKTEQQGMIQRQVLPRTDARSGTEAVANPRPSRSDLVTIANTAINAEYVGAARDGLTDFESDVGSTFDYGSAMAALTGNLIWATACFATGGTAFAISLVGIGVGTGAPAASGTVDRAAFHQRGADVIEEIRVRLLNKIVPVTNDVDQQATAQNWDEFRTRRELLLQLLRPEYIAVVAGGLPTVNRAAIAHTGRIQLLTEANTYGASLWHPGGGGQFIYDYTVSNHSETSGFWPLDSTHLRPAASWQFTRGSTQLYIPQGESSAHSAFTRIPLIQPADMPFTKTVYIHAAGTSWDDLIIYLDGSNNITGATGYGVFEDFAQPPSRPASRSAPPPADPVGVSRMILTQMWSATGGLPPWVRGQDLGYGNMPGRSRATR
jgi:hypothetical protein